MAKQRVFLGLILSMCFTVGLSAQDTKEESADQQAKVQEQDKGKKQSKAASKEEKRLIKAITRSFNKAKLTDDQKTKIGELVGEQWSEFETIQDEMSDVISKEDRKKKAAALKKAKADGQTGKEANKTAIKAIGMTEEDQEKMAELTGKRRALIAEIKKEVRETFTAVSYTHLTLPTKA